jgi:cyclically-permuted mutarotase family protein
MSLLLLSGLLSAVSLYAQQGRIVWSEPIRLPMGLAGALAGVDHGMLFVGGGCNFPDSMPWAGGKKKYYNEVYVVDLSTRAMIVVDTLSEPVAYGAPVTTPQGVVYIGGENESGPTAAVLCLSWDSVARQVGVRRLPDLPVALTNAAAALVGETIYVAGGETAAGVSDRLYALDLRGSAWRLVGALPKPLSHAVLIAAGHRLYLAGGRRRNPGGVSDLSDAVYCYDTVVRRWSVCRSLPYALSAGTGVLYDEHSLLLLGGDRGEVFHEVEKLIAAADRSSSAAEWKELLLQKARVQSSHPGFSRQVLRYDMHKNEWSDFDTLPFPSPATTTAVRWGNYIVIPGGEIRAGVRTSQILIGVISR